MVREISLADKCQLLFGAAVTLIVFATLIAPWVLLRSVVDLNASDTAHELVDLWPTVPAVDPLETGPHESLSPEGGDSESKVILFKVERERFEEAAEQDEFVAASLRLFENDAALADHDEAVTSGWDRVFRHSRAVRSPSGDLTAIVWAEHRSKRAVGHLFVSRLYLVGAGILAGAGAVLVFHLITTRLILRPVRELRETADRIREGELTVRAEIETGDDFEELADAFNAMLEELAAGQAQLRALNQSLDFKVEELEKSNLSLHEAARVKADFIASVSHELRTPLNSIIGFAELLEGIARKERPQAGEALVLDPAQYEKRLRFLENIVLAGRSLLEMINELLDVAKIEAGKMDLHVERMSVATTCEALLGLIRAQAERKGITLKLEMPGGTSDLGLPSKPGANGEGGAALIETDPKKFQQIIFNFLSNAVKFTPKGGVVTLRAERIVGGDSEPRVRVSVLDTGQGIPRDDRDRIFEKFTQIETGVTREHGGTGLGLAICRELTAMIQGEIQLVSEEGQGSMFSLIVPLAMSLDVATDQALRTAGRGPASRAEADSVEEQVRSSERSAQ